MTLESQAGRWKHGTEWEARDIERTRSGIIGRNDTVVTITGEARCRIFKAVPIEFGGTLQTIPHAHLRLVREGTFSVTVCLALHPCQQHRTAGYSRTSWRGH